ncbi:O-antigen ligase family protein [Clostridium sp. DL1XJH146]
MEFFTDLKEYMGYLKKRLFIILGLYFFIELFIFMQLWTTNKFMFISSIFITLYMIVSIFLCFKDFETTIKVYVLSIPIVPILLYLCFRLGIVWVGTGVYWLYFILFIVGTFKAYKKNEIDFDQISFKGKYRRVLIIYSVLTIISMISSFLSYSKIESFNLTLLAIVSIILISLILLSYKGMNRRFIESIITYLCIGVSISSIPDITVSVYSLIFSGNNIHLYGVLGSNFMLGYTIIILPYILYFAVNKNICNRYNQIFKVLLLIEILNLSTQLSRGILLTVFICILLIICIDRENFKKYLLVSIIIFTCLGYNVTHRWEFNQIKDDIKVEGIQFIIEDEGILSKIAQQFKSRRPIWIVATNMIEDNPCFGVGLGSFKYRYLYYGGSESRLYIDSHNIFLNVATELGLIFALVLFSCLFIFLFTSFIKNLKFKEFASIIFPGIIGIISLLVYGNITGQAFITSTFPVSIVPVFVFTVVVTIIIKMNSLREGE